MSDPNVVLARLKSLVAEQKLSVLEAFEQINAESHPAEAEILRRCSLVRSFDRSMYGEVLTSDLKQQEIPQFDDFVSSSAVERIPRTKEEYRVRESARERNANYWRSRKDEFHNWHQRLSLYYSHREIPDVPNLIYHTLHADPERGLALFEESYRDADSRFRLAECFTLLSILKASSLQLSAEQVRRRNEWESYYRARALFADSYFRSSTYYSRVSLHSAFLGFLKGDGPWIFHVHATGGMGKSIFLRWAVARHLVLERVPCAKVDLDDYRLAVVREHPWLLLLPLAKQLDEQTGGFTNLLDSFNAHLSYLRSPGTDVLSDATFEMQQEDGPAVERAFCSIVQSCSLPKVVIALDTLEGITFSRTALTECLRMFQRVRAEVPGIQLLLAGRYNIPDKLPELGELFAKEATIFEVDRFSDDEAREYLGFRNVKSTTIVDAIIEKVGERDELAKPRTSNPFKLSLFAEIVLGRVGITKEEIEKLPRADFAYLLERVILRIPEQPLRWVVRYGVLPRELTKDFVSSVLVEPLRAALRGHATADQPKLEWPDGLQEYADQDVWTQDPHASTEIETLWKDLERYESERGWLTRVTDTAVKFHSDVAGPMRDLLSRQRVFAELQQRAIQYFEERAIKEPNRWAEWTSEAIFHAFQWRGSEADAYWEEALTNVKSQESPAVRRRLAEEVLRAEYAEDERWPRCRAQDGSPIVSVTTLGRAHAASARAIVDLVTVGLLRKEDAVEDLRIHIELAEAIQTSTGEHLLSVFVTMMAKMFTLGLAGNVSSMLPGFVLLVRDTIGKIKSKQEQSVLRIQLAEILASQSEEQSIKELRAVVEDFPTFPPHGIEKSDLRVKLARLEAAIGNFSAANEEYRNALLECHGDEEAAYQIQKEHWEFAIETGDVASAAGLGRRLRSSGAASVAPRDAAIDRLEAVTARACGETIRGLECADRAVQRAKLPEDRARSLQTRAEVRGDLFDFSSALLDCEQSEGIWERSLSSDAPAEIGKVRLCAVRLVGRVMGNVRDALGMIHQAESLRGARSPMLWAALQTEKVLALSRLSIEPGEARATWEEGYRESARWPLVQRARFLAIGLAIGVAPSDDSFVTDFIRTLSKIEPAGARFGVLEGFSFSSELKIGWRLRRKLRALFPMPEIDSVEFATASLQLAEVLRVLGEKRDARKVLLRMLHFGSSLSAHPTLLLRWIGAFRRTKADALLTEHLRVYTPQGLGTESHPGLRAALLLEFADSAVSVREIPRVAQLLAEAESLFSVEKLASHWRGRLLVAQGRLAALNGLEREAQTALLQAKDMYRSLGDEVSAANVDQTAGEALRSEIGISTEDSRSIILIPGGKGEGKDSRLDSLAPRPGTKVSTTLAETIVKNWPEVRGDLFDSLFDRESLSRLRSMSDPCGLYLQIPLGFLTSVPWELVEFPGEEIEGPGGQAKVLYIARRPSHGNSASRQTIRWVQTALRNAGDGTVSVDGIMGPETRSAIKRFQKDLDIAPSGDINDALRHALHSRSAEFFGSSTGSMLLVQPREVGLAFEATSYEGRGGFSLTAKYLNSGGAVHTLTEPGIEELGKAIYGLRPAVIYFVGTMRERNGAIYLDFARATSSRAPDLDKAAFTTAALDRMLASLPPDAPRPFVILDIARAQSDWQAIVDLSLRNQFAGDLLDFDDCSGILATGLAELEDLDRLTGMILDGLNQGVRMGELSMAIRRLARRHQEGRHLRATLPFLGTALFTRDADLPCLVSSHGTAMA